MMDDDEEEEYGETVVIDREPTEVPVDDEGDRTVVVGRVKPATEVGVDKTVAVDRTRRGKKSAGRAPDPESVLKVLPRRTIKVAPVAPGFGREAVEAVGANAVETYLPREIAPAPTLGPQPFRAGDALRVPAPAMPSVARQSRSAGVVTLLVFGGSCVISTVSIIAIIVWFARGS